MPQYHYKCEDCDDEFKKTQRLSEDAIVKCIKCGGKLYKVMDGPCNFILKGTGFYSTGG